jgi:hypothetical protein
MESIQLEGHTGTPLVIDSCRTCQGFWFDPHESLKLAPAATLRLFTLIGETPKGRTQLATVLRCPRCRAQLALTHDLQRNTPFRYWKCPSQHGRFITFFEFLREKDFIRPLSARQLEELRRNVQSVNCSNCGGPVDLARTSACDHCGTPLSILDLEQAGQIVEQLKRAAEPRPIDPALPLELMRARREVEALFADDADWLKNAASTGLVEAGFGAVMAWLTKSKT